MTNILSDYEVVVGIFLPLLISVFIRDTWTDKTKIGVSFIFVVLAAIGNLFYSGLWNPTDFGGTVLKILVLTVTTYKGFWSATGLTEALKKNVGLT